MPEIDRIQLVRVGWEAFNRGDIDTVVAFVHPDIEWWPSEDELIVEPYRGIEGYLELISATREGVPDIKAEIEEIFEAGEWVVTKVRFWGRGGQSGAPVELRETQISRFQDGKLIEVHEYRELDDALEALERGFG